MRHRPSTERRRGRGAATVDRSHPTVSCLADGRSPMLGALAPEGGDGIKPTVMPHREVGRNRGVTGTPPAQPPQGAAEPFDARFCRPLRGLGRSVARGSHGSAGRRGRRAASPWALFRRPLRGLESRACRGWGICQRRGPRGSDRAGRDANGGAGGQSSDGWKKRPRLRCSAGPGRVRRLTRKKTRPATIKETRKPLRWRR